MYIDTHCHLNFKAFDIDLDDVIKRANDAGVTRFIIPGAKLDSSRRAVEIAGKYPGCFAAVGIHPHHAQEYKMQNANWVKEQLRELTSHDDVVAMGEIGLDYYTYKNASPISPEEKQAQKELLLLQLEIAKECNLPVILHCREAQNDILSLIQSFQHPVRGVFHCFDGTSDYLKEVLRLGFFVGFDGNSTYPANAHLRDLVVQTPLDRLLLETDAPYLTPVPHRGTRNEPAYIHYIAATVAAAMGRAREAISDATCQNAVNLFQLHR